MSGGSSPKCPGAARLNARDRPPNFQLKVSLTVQRRWAAPGGLHSRREDAKTLKCAPARETLERNAWVRQGEVVEFAMPALALQSRTKELNLGGKKEESPLPRWGGGKESQETACAWRLETVKAWRKSLKQPTEPPFSAAFSQVRYGVFYGVLRT
jgi:hypothetical protein